MDSLAKVLDFVIHEKQQHRTAFPIFLESSQSVVLVFIKATFGCSEHVQKTEVGRFTLRSALRMHKRHEVEDVSRKFPKENIASMKL